MSYKIEQLFINTPLLLLLILLMILLMFCFMQQYVYKFQPLIFNESDLIHNRNYNKKPCFNDKINKIIKLKDREIKKNIRLLSQTINETRKKLQENFNDISVDVLQSNLNTLDNLEFTIKDFENNDMNNIKSTMELIKTQRIANKAKIVDFLTNIYVLASIDNINKSNAVSYNEYLKYNTLNNNIYNNQYR